MSKKKNRKQKTLPEQLDAIRDRISKLEQAMMGAKLVFPGVKALNAMPLTQYVEPAKVEMSPLPPTLQPYTPQGVMVGAKAWAAYTGEGEDDPPRVLSVSVTALDKKQEMLTIVFDEDGSEAEYEFGYVFPLNDAGKKRAELIINQLNRDEREKEIKRTLTLIYAYEGDLSVKALEQRGNRTLISLAGIAGMSAFKELKGLQGKDRIKAVAAGLKKWRKANPPNGRLVPLKKLVKEYEAEMKKLPQQEPPEDEDIARAKEIAATVGLEQKKAREATGRTLGENSIPLGPVIGDIVVDGRDWFRIVAEGDIKGLYVGEHMAAAGSRKSFVNLKYQRLSARKQTPIWSPS